MDKIKCPHCGKQVEISEAIVHELSEKVREEEKEKTLAQIEKAKLEERAQSEKRLKEEFEVKNKNSQAQMQDALKKQKELEEILANKEKEEKEKEVKIKLDAKKTAEEEQSIKLREKDIQMDQVKKLAEELRKANEDLKKKLEQGSQQLQGEALELDLEEKLRATFPNDEFVPIPKGVEGGDIWQKVRFNNKVVGSIIWETKRTKAWSNSWLTKLKDDSSKISATEAIIVSQVLPDDVTNFDRKEGVWLTTYEDAISICRYIRFLITTVSQVKSSTSHTDEEWGKIREYMLSDDFKHRMRTHFESVKILKDSLGAEERATKLRWRKQQALLEKLDNNTYEFYLDLKNIVPNLPEIESIEPLLIINNNDDQDTLV